jgi:hypothetical protein
LFGKGPVQSPQLYRRKQSYRGQVLVCGLRRDQIRQTVRSILCDSRVDTAEHIQKSQDSGPGFLLRPGDSQVVEDIRHVVGVLFFLGEDVFKDTARGGIAFADVLNDLAVAVDRDTLSH